MRTIEELQQAYSQKCAELGDLVYKQRHLHGLAESAIRDLESLDQEARTLKAATETPTETKE